MFQPHRPSGSSWNLLHSFLPLPATLSTWLASFNPSDLCSLLPQKSFPRLSSLETVLLILTSPLKVYPKLRLIFIITVVTEQHCSFIYLMVFSLPTWPVNFMRMGAFSFYFQCVEGGAWCILEAQSLQNG